MTPVEIGAAIKFRREFLGLRQEDVAEISGMTVRTLHAVEKGTGNPSLLTLDKLATVLGMTLQLNIKSVG